MQSEALRHIRTMRQVKTNFDLRNQRVKTTNSLSRTEGEAAHLCSLNDPQIGRILSKERQRSAAMEASVNKSRQRLLRARDRLAATINKNRALTELRYELQQPRLEKKVPIPEKIQTPEKAQKLIEVKVKLTRPTRKTRKPKLRRVALKY
jgi:hypothetical protein